MVSAAPEPPTRGFASDVLEEVLRSGPFHIALRLAIDARGLGLERLRDRLAQRGLPVSVSTLSNWQRGLSRPDRPRSRQALAVLEELLEVPAGALSRLLGPAPQRARGDIDPGTPRLRADQLRAELDGAGPGVPAERPTAVTSAYENVVVGPGAEAWRCDHRIVVVARRSGVDRHIALYHSREHGPLPEVSVGDTCRLGRVRTDRAAGLIAAELLFDCALGKGETYPVDYRWTGVSGLSRRYTGRWFRDPGAHYDLAVRFEEAAPAAAYRIWRLDANRPHKDRAELRLIDGRIAHFAESGLEPGFHGIRWE